MSADQAAEAPESEGGQSTAMYVYGIVPADVEPEEHAKGVGKPPSDVAVVRHGDIAALVSEISVDRPLGTPDDLKAHAELLDGSAAVAPVLPLRFGAVMTDAESVEKELLEENHDELKAALDELEGRAQFVIKGRYVENAVLREVLDENSEAARLREEIRDKSEDATRDARMALGEIITQAIEAKRAEDTRRVIDTLEALEPMVNERQPTHEEDAAHIAVLVELDRQGELEEAVGSLAQEWDGRVEMTLLGPMAAYDFVMKREPEG
ncbi:GvpL/GvpF family gas vesicle protein [Rhodococcus ruber]|uniref:GvpL/GvpF family gas vesicle protein n=1 Tax=Rhodococcus ruber TaxID=1830 RepID=UPI001780E621|nr:GvpL/GvpF family gas vesicle protein [Rhodococcus ruber]MBD8053839.1 GvpL/GvpF family gas vesicle protein [Rhodococcus ruber]